MRWLLASCSFLVGTAIGAVAAVYAMAIATSSWPHVVPPGWSVPDKEAS